MTRQPGHLNGSRNKNFRGSNENWRTGSTCVGFSSLKGRQQMHKHFTFEYVTPSDLKYYLKIAEKTNIIKIIKEDYENKRRT